jgi:hypothetical protein
MAILIRIRSEISIYGYVYQRIQIRCIFVCTALANPKNDHFGSFSLLLTVPRVLLYEQTIGVLMKEKGRIKQ